MKKVIALSLLLALLLCGCSRGGGEVDGAHLNIGPSQLYGEGEVRAAMRVVMDEFKKMEGACTLRELSYDEEASSKAADEWARQYHADEAIVIGSVFDVAEENGPITLEPGSTHKWSWVLTRNGRGGWTLQTYGYA